MNKDYLENIFVREDYIEICKKLFEKFGRTQEVIMCLEEMAELQKELCKNINRNKSNVDEIASEIADVYLMLKQVQILYNITDKDIKNIMDYKVDRLKEKGEDLENGNKNLYTDNK
ncbi:MAG: hypothetical protein LBC92_01390 [Rickettsiales bacterium]|jgi:NTP pyrophosphatase (non-canonical NTP hydrolase)|nr:hypothetical protein [Rickettsiales bacterium]